MRLWHKDLIPILPRQQLVGQWRECCLIAKTIQAKGTPNHILVNKIMDYPIEQFIRYGELIFQEMTRREYRTNPENFLKYFNRKTFDVPDNGQAMFEGWHNDEYFRQCYYNLQEKYQCGGMTDEEWKKIVELNLQSIQPS